MPEDTQLVNTELGMKSSWFSSRIAAHFLVTTPLNPSALGLPLMETPSGSSETLFSEHICKNPKEILSLDCFQLTYWSAPVGKLPRTPWLYTQLLLEKELRNKGGLMPVGCADQPRAAGTSPQSGSRALHVTHKLVQALLLPRRSPGGSLCSQSTRVRHLGLWWVRQDLAFSSFSCTLLSGGRSWRIWPGLVPGLSPSVWAEPGIARWGADGSLFICWCHQELNRG